MESKIHWAWATCVAICFSVLCLAIAFSPGDCGYSEHHPNSIRAKGELIEKQIELEKLRIDQLVTEER